MPAQILALCIHSVLPHLPSVAERVGYATVLQIADFLSNAEESYGLHVLPISYLLRAFGIKVLIDEI